MTPKEKAEELFNKNYKLFQNTDTCFGDCEEEYKIGNYTNSGHGCGIWKNLSKQCALIAVDEILKIIHTNMEDKYWEEVKQEIKKL